MSMSGCEAAFRHHALAPCAYIQDVIIGLLITFAVAVSSLGLRTELLRRWVD